MRYRRVALIAGAALLTVMAARHPSADLQLTLQEPADPAPHRVQAAVDLGIMTFSLLITWTGRHLAL